MKEVLLSVKAVKSMHSLHLWALTLGQALVSVHVAIGETTQPCATSTHTHTHTCTPQGSNSDILIVVFVLFP